jgi:hypothetical protein
MDVNNGRLTVLFENRRDPGQDFVQDRRGQRIDLPALPLRFANSPSVVIGRITGSFVASLNAAGDTTSTGR